MIGNYSDSVTATASLRDEVYSEYVSEYVIYGTVFNGTVLSWDFSAPIICLREHAFIIVILIMELLFLLLILFRGARCLIRSPGTA